MVEARSQSLIQPFKSVHSRFALPLMLELCYARSPHKIWVSTMWGKSTTSQHHPELEYFSEGQ